MGFNGDLLEENSNASVLVQKVALSMEKQEKPSVIGQSTRSLLERILRRVFPDQRKNERHLEPPMVGHLGMAHTSKPYELADISVSGFCLLTDERWERGTEMPITLRRTDLPKGKEPEIFTVQATVVRYEKRGVAFSIALSEEESKAVSGNPLNVRWITRLEMQDFLNRIKGSDADGTCAQEASRVSAAVHGKSSLNAVYLGGD